VQVEALRALATGWATGGRYAAAYGRMVERQWRFIQEELFDERYGGVFARPAGDAGLRRVLPLKRYRWNLRKGDLWKDASHETDSLVAGIRLLRSGQVEASAT
jgi:hypothetical protein